MATKSNGTASVAPMRRPPRGEPAVDHRTVHESAVPRSELSPIQKALLQVLRARGGRMWMVDLVFEMRWRGARAEVVRGQLDGLVQRGLVRGPLAQLAYELTTSGWDLSRTP
jgi:hypothetical protein